MKSWSQIFGWLIGLVASLWRLTCQCRFENDSRPALKQVGKNYIYALLHAHQMAAVLGCDEKMSAMVSRSKDGDLLVPSLRLRGVIPVRGSTRSRGQDKGGQEALHELQQLMEQGIPALLAVDGPKGPRNKVHRGVAKLALTTGAIILPVAAISSSYWVLSRTWDKFQIPKPFCKIRIVFSNPIDPMTMPDEEQLCDKIEQELRALEQS